MSKRKQIPDVMSQLQGLGGAVPPPPVTTPVEEEIPTRAALAPPPERETIRPRRNKNRTPKSRLVGRATYDIGKELKEAIHQESVDLGVPASQLAKYLLLYAWDFYVNEEIPQPAMSRSDSPKFRNRIDFAE
jgi:hypothetical protein